MNKLNASGTCNPFVPWIALLAIGSIAGPASGALVISLEDATLRPNTSGQPIDLIIRSTSDDDPGNVTGINLNAFLGDGLGERLDPIFGGGPTIDVDDGGVVFRDGPGGRDYVFDAFAGSASDSAVDGNEQFQISSFTFSERRGVRPEGILATLYVDTTGIRSGEFELTLFNDPTETDFNFPATELILAAGTDSEPRTESFRPQTAGPLTVAVVPEPSTTLLLMLSSLAGLGIRYRR